jgi:hypothetical protein
LPGGGALGQLWRTHAPRSARRENADGTLHQPGRPRERLTPHPDVEKHKRAKRSRVGQSGCHSRTVRMSHQASATSAPTHATVIRAPSAMTIGVQSGRPGSAGRFGRAASRVERRSTVSLGCIWPLPCGRLGSRVETHLIRKSHRDTQMGNAYGGGTSCLLCCVSPGSQRT